MNNIEDFIEKFIIAVDFQEPVPVAPDSVFVDFPEWDSLATLGVIVMFDTEYDKTISGDDLSKVTTIAELHQLAIA
ncbi:acyl carrier protein [Castellaniella sp.]|uniref:acyl carrier protein n=1 Tax=Castellaniella sp. TaxID=1955812 RepID=UPI002AFEC2FA|nr:acyl carrier protein [Castellaniella sp.]